MLLRRRRYAVGLAMIVVVAVIWSLASLVVADAEDQGVDPYWITFVCNSLFVLLLPLSSGNNNNTRSARYLSPLWMIANGAYNVSLSLTSITSSTILSTTSSLWALFFAVRWNVEPRAAVKTRVLGALLCIAGSALAAFSDSSTKNESFFGDIVALFSAALYGAYGAGLRLSDDSEKAPFRFFGMLGLWNFAYFAVPLAVYLAVACRNDLAILAKKTGFSQSHSENGGQTFGLIVAKGLFDNVLSDFLWAQAVIRTTPTVATVGLSLTIPLAFLTDAFVTRDLSTNPRSLALQITGAALVVAGFVCTVLASSPPPEEYGRDDDLVIDVVGGKLQEQRVVSDDDDDDKERGASSSSEVHTTTADDYSVRSVVQAATTNMMLVTKKKKKRNNNNHDGYDDALLGEDASSSTRSPLLADAASSSSSSEDHDDTE